MGNEAPRLVTVVLVVSNLDRAVELYSAGFGLDLHIDDHAGPDPWTTGRHAAVSWTNGAFMHFALYEKKDGSRASGAQVAFGVADLDAAHQRATAAGAEVLHAPLPQPWGRSARLQGPRWNVIELTQST